MYTEQQNCDFMLYTIAVCDVYTFTKCVIDCSRAPYVSHSLSLPLSPSPSLSLSPFLSLPLPLSLSLPLSGRLDSSRMSPGSLSSVWLVAQVSEDRQRHSNTPWQPDTSTLAKCEKLQNCLFSFFFLRNTFKSLCYK